jgi:carbamate kinase
MEPGLPRTGPMGGRTVVALGGNALARAGSDDSWPEAVLQMRRTAPALAEMISHGGELVVTHGNGPQVGMLLRQNEIAHREVPPRPLDVLGAETEGQIGYLIQQELTSALASRKVARTVLAFTSRMVVSSRDRAFRRPTKPVGQYYNETEARWLRKQRGWALVHDPARGGWRRLVPSPRPLRWVEGPAMRALLRGPASKAVVPVVAGGGGIPVVERRRGRYEGVEAVIDKDLAAALVARTLGAQTLAILTDVPAISVGFGKPWERPLGRVRARELERALRAGEFGEGTMAPKVHAVLDFLAEGGRRAIVTDPANLSRALEGRAGTRVEL